MNTKSNYIVLAASALLLILAGCVGNPVLNIENAPIQVSAKHNSTDIKKAIMRAGAGLGWVIKEKSPGHLVGTIFLRKHTASVDIKYTGKAYSITYKNSENLNYDGTNIHKNYNGWVRNLNHRIQSELSIL